MNKIFQSTFKARRRVFVVALSVVLVLASATAAFAAWPSFQDTNANNGVITVSSTGAPPPTDPGTTARSVQLPTNNPSGNVYTGIDAASVLNNEIAYTVYNSGETPVTANSGGARVKATRLYNSSSAWNVELFDANVVGDVHANNVSQLSTPYTDGTYLYAAKTYYTNDLASGGLFGWTDSSGNPVTGSVSIPANGSVALAYSSLTVPADFWSPQLLIKIASGGSSSLSANVTLTPVGAGSAVTFGSSGYYGGASGTLTLYNNSGNIVKQGTYKVTVTLSNGSSSALTIGLSGFEFNSSRWALYSLPLSNGTPKRLLNGYGQANTPVSYDNSNNIYFGIYEGDRSYYQAKVNAGALVTGAIFRPTNGDDFYGAGAVYVSSSDSRIIFGSDSGTLYSRPIANFATGQGSTLTITPADKIRSSIAYVTQSSQPFLYFTSYNGTTGKLWRYDGNHDILSSVALSNASTSTPVVSDNGYIYVGTYNGFTSGTVEAFPIDDFSVPYKEIIYSGDPVQSSPIVYSTSDGDYIYFTTNSNSTTYVGTGYCYSFDGSNPAPIWSAAAANAVLQGMAYSEGYVVWGDDSNKLYIAP
jgi:hypothetical protein